MQTSGQKKKGELLAEAKGKFVSTTVREISPSGIRLEINDEGQITGKYKANHIETVSVLQKTDGTNEWQTKGIETTPEGDFIALWGGGTGKATGPTTQQWEGQIQFMTQSRRLSWLNGTKAWVEGEGDAAKGEFHGKWYRLT
ncbi:MAG: hypothetical protein E6K84_05395 [Thaumarchaeota archaeon]|nr:MAG: hypothetical protein E6K84_05395 [Nitrososphaerota archaeon]